MPSKSMSIFIKTTSGGILDLEKAWNEAIFDLPT
jgi:hypothetical protein